MSEILDCKLCYVDSSEYENEPMTLYFTEKDVNAQWGDDWGDTPYEHNAGSPYEYDYSQPEMGVKDGVGIYPKILIYKIKLVVSQYFPKLYTPRTNLLNSPYSVEDINKKIVPWITIEHKDGSKIFIHAGMTVKEFLNLMGNYKDSIDLYIPYTEDLMKYLENRKRDDL